MSYNNTRLLCKLRPYTIQTPEKAFAVLYKARLIETINEQNFGRQF